MASIQRVCSIENCKSLHDARGLCRIHYKRLIKYNDPLHPGRSYTRHNLTGHYIRDIWLNIKNRIYRPTHPEYRLYGGRGILMCQGWKESVTQFYCDMGDRPTNKHSIDRKDVNGNYSCGKCPQCIDNNWPMNCRWTVQQVQVWNRNKLDRNKSGYIGVMQSNSKWMARITNDGKTYSLGYYIDPVEAAIAYDKAVLFFRGSNGVTNIL